MHQRESALKCPLKIGGHLRAISRDLKLPASECFSSSDTYAAGHTYDSNGNKLTDTDANGHVTHYVHDVLN